MRNSGSPTVYAERAILVSALDPRTETRDDPFEELTSLAETAGARIVGRVVQRRERPNTRTFIGTGKVGELSHLAQDEKADVAIFDQDLSPAQVRNLEKELKIRAVDRTELILDIFATHARSREARLQVELAQLEYTLPRLKAMAAHITSEQQAGGIGIGLRGPGEKQIETDRRHARRRISDLRRELEDIGKRKRREVAARAGRNTCVSIVGYTNAGKSTLMNALTKAGVLVEDRLFSTLDTRTRLWNLRAGTKALLSDTVGFLRDLPHALVASFHATLEEVAQADLLLHVVDASHPEAGEHIKAVQTVLGELRCAEKPQILVFNKIDRLRDAVELSILRNAHPECVCLSAVTGEGLEELDARVHRILSERLVEMDVEIPLAEGRLLAEIDGHSVVLERRFVDSSVRMKLRAPARAVWKIEKYRRPLTTKSR